MRVTVACLVLSNALAISPAAAADTGYPARPVRLIVAFAPGGGADFMGRIVALTLSSTQGYSMVVDNRAGAGGVIGTDLVAKANPDGYTLGLANNTTHVMIPVLNAKAPYRPLRDFTPVSLISYAPQLLVVPSTVPARTVAELIALAVAKPDTLNYASGGEGSQTHLAGELLRINTGIRISHIPYKSTGPGFTALMSGEAQLMFVSMPAAIPFIQSGRIRALAVTGNKRSALLPDMATLAESGVRGFDINPWFGVVGPARLPANILTKLHDDIARSLQTDQVKRLLAGQGAEAAGSTPEEFSAVIKSDLAQWTGIVAKAGIHID